MMFEIMVYLLFKNKLVATKTKERTVNPADVKYNDLLRYDLDNNESDKDAISLTTPMMIALT